MDKETRKKLLKPFPKEYHKPAPKGRFGKYVPHYRYVERLRDCLGDNYGWKVEAIYGIYKGEQRIVGAKGTITIEGLGTFDGVGDVKDFQLSSQADGTNYKFAESDAFKRACMHFGLGVELWSGDVTEEEDMVNEAHSSNTEDTPKKKEVAQETGTPHSKPRITEASLKEIVLTSCKDNVDFAKKCYKDCMNRTIIKTRQDDIALWEDETITTFLDLVEIYITKHEDSFKDRESNSKLINDGLDVGLELEEIEDKEEEKEMDFDNDDWKAGKEADPMTDAQEGFLKSLITQAIDSGLDELGAQAKQYLNSDKTSKVTCSDMINKLKNAIDNANG